MKAKELPDFYSALEYAFNKFLPILTNYPKILLAWKENPWLSILSKYMSDSNMSYTSKGLLLDQKQLIIWLDNQRHTITLSCKEKIKPLLDYLNKAYAEYDLPLPDYAGCMGEKPLYPDAQKPITFKAMQFPAPEPLPSFIKTTTIQINQGETISVIHTKPSRSQRLRKKLKEVKPSTTIFISYAWDKWGSQQLHFLQNRFLHNTLVTDLRMAGLSPWLDIREMTGDMDKQMQENIAESRFVILIGTALYAQRSKLVDCQLLRLSSFTVNDDLQALPLTTDTAYIHTPQALFYVSDKAANKVVWLQHLSPQALQEFDDVTQLNTLALNQAHPLSKGTLSQITLATRHSCNNVRKELEFILDKARREETGKDFIIPLWLEGDFDKTFGEPNEVNQKFLLHDCKSWFSVSEGKWKSYKAYILTFTRTSPAIGILPILLGFSSASDNAALRLDYEQRASRLALELENLERSHLITGTTPLEIRLQENLYFESQKTLFHTFLREVAVLTQQPGQTLNAIPSPITNDDIPARPTSENSTPSDSQAANSSPSATTSSGSNATHTTSSSNAARTTTAPTTTPANNATSGSNTNNAPSSNPQTGRYAFFPAQQPTGVWETQKLAELKQNLREFIDDHDYTFSLERVDSSGKQDRRLGASADHALVIQFTAKEEILESDTEIREKLEILGNALKQSIQSSSISFKPKWLKPNWKDWILTIYTNSNEDTDRVAALLQKTSEGVIEPETVDHRVNCAFQIQ